MAQPDPLEAPSKLLAMLQEHKSSGGEPPLEVRRMQFLFLQLQSSWRPGSPVPPAGRFTALLPAPQELLESLQAMQAAPPPGPRYDDQLEVFPQPGWVLLLRCWWQAAGSHCPAAQNLKPALQPWCAHTAPFTVLPSLPSCNRRRCTHPRVSPRALPAGL